MCFIELKAYIYKQIEKRKSIIFLNIIKQLMVNKIKQIMVRE